MASSDRILVGLKGLFCCDFVVVDVKTVWTLLEVKIELIARVMVKI